MPNSMAEFYVHGLCQEQSDLFDLCFSSSADSFGGVQRGTKEQQRRCVQLVRK